MSKKDEALKLALEALENAWLDASMGKGDVARHVQAITAIREALAKQPAQQQEPAFYRHEDGHLMTPDRANFLGFDLNELQPLYTSPPAQQEPLGTVKELFTQTAWERLDLHGSTKVYISPQSKPWVGLTDEEERKAFEQWYVCNAFDYERNPIGSRECGLQWSAWKARAAHGITG